VGSSCVVARQQGARLSVEALGVACPTPPRGSPGSAVERVIDQYPVSKDRKSGIVSDPNRADDPEYIVGLIGQVIRVSLEMVRIVKSLPSL